MTISYTYTCWTLLRAYDALENGGEPPNKFVLGGRTPSSAFTLSLLDRAKIKSKKDSLGIPLNTSLTVSTLGQLHQGSFSCCLWIRFVTAIVNTSVSICLVHSGGELLCSLTILSGSISGLVLSCSATLGIETTTVLPSDRWCSWPLEMLENNPSQWFKKSL